METTRMGLYRVQGLGFKLPYWPIMEKQMENKMENEMETGGIQGFKELKFAEAVQPQGVQIPLKTPSTPPAAAWPPPPPPAMAGGLVQPDHPA